MPIPGFQDFMGPFLQRLADGSVRTMQEMNDSLAAQFGLSEAEKAELLPSGTQKVYINRIGWTRTYLKKAGLLESPGRAQVRITKAGLDVLAAKPERIDVKYLNQFPSFVQFHKLELNSADSIPTPEIVEVADTSTPEERLLQAYQSIRSSLAEEVLTRVSSCSPAFFERLVVELVVRMGYGGSMADAGRAIGKSGDGGIDGIIKEDRLGLDVIYLQAKRWSDSVGRPEIQKFAGALDGQRARKGIFITTSTFTKDAKEFASIIDKKIILIDGVELANLMIDFNVGVASVSTFEVKKVDLDYFEES